MRAVTVAIEQQELLRRAGANAIRDIEVDIDADLSADGFAVDVVDPEGDARRLRAAAAAWELLVKKLSGGAIARAALEDARATFGEDTLLVALAGVVDALLALRVLDEREITAVVRARADCRQLITAPEDVPATTTPPRAPPSASSADGTTTPAAPHDAAEDPFEGSDTGRWEAPSQVAVARALASVVGQEPVPQPPAATTTTTLALLRVRATTTAAARSLRAVAEGALGTFDVSTLPTSPDELLVAAGPRRGGGADAHAPREAVAVLVRAASAIASSLPEGTPLSFAIVAGSGDVVDDTVRAGALLPRSGLMAFDEIAWERAGELAVVPGELRVVDARTPHGAERWELSAMLLRPPFVGREDDVRVCAELLARGGERARLLMLHGPPGIGKSTLLREALAEAGLLDERAAVLWGAADPLQPTPYAAVVGMLRALARAPAGHPRAEARIERLVDGLSPLLPASEQTELKGLCPVLVDLLGAGSDDDDDVADRRSPRALRTALRRAILLIARALLARAKDDRPAVFVVSGAEAMDAPTRDTLMFLARRLGAAARIVLLATQKPRLPQGFEDAFDVTRREIEPLDEISARRLAEALLDVTPADGLEGDAGSPGGALGRAVRVLHEKARGSPLFLAHAVRWAVEGGLLRRTAVIGGSEWDAARFDDAAQAGRMPTRIDKLLHARVMRLPAVARKVLAHCATLGLTFTPAAVEFVGVRLGLPRDDVLRAVQLLTETGFLARSQPRPGAPVFADDVSASDELLVFEHPLLRAAAEQALSADEVVAVHGVVADALEALVDTRAVAPMLARHHRLAERRRQAVLHLVTAVRRARRLDDRQGAITMAREGLDLCLPDETDLIFSLQLELCAVLEPTAAQGDKQQKALKDALKQLVRVAEKTGDPHRISTAFARVARFNLFLGDVEKAEDAALRALDRARRAAVADGDVAADARAEQRRRRGPRDALRLLALVRFAGRDLDGAQRALDEARRLTDDDDRRVLGVIEHQAGLFCLEGNDPLTALEHLLVARAHKRAVGDLAGEAACLDAIADVYIRTGRLWTALSLLVRALSIREAIGDDAGFAQSLKNRAEVLLLAGDIDAAREEALRARALARGLSLDRLEHQASIVVARSELAREDAAAAESILDNVRRRVDDKRDPFAAMEAELLSARAKWLRARQSVGAARERLLKTALARARAAVEIGERRGFLSGQVLGNALLGDVLTSAGDVGLALPYALRAVELLDNRTATGLPIEDVLGAVARVQQAVGDDDEAAAARARARALLDERARRLPDALRERFWSVPARQAMLDVHPVGTSR